MTGPADFPAASNPFSTRFTRPGAIPYRFADTTTAAELIERFLSGGSRGQIVGPHGSGKSTLLAALTLAFHERGLATTVFTLHDGQRRLPAEFFTLTGDDRRIVIVDGYEQLGRWHRWRLARRCRRRGWGLLVSGHEPLGFPTLCRTRVELDLAQSLVRDLLPEGDLRIGDEEVRAAFQAHDGDMRETFFALYDVYEARRSAGTEPDA
jgi:energy-coupling factor transporter ATP-binding protein EcfA2